MHFTELLINIKQYFEDLMTIHNSFIFITEYRFHCRNCAVSVRYRIVGFELPNLIQEIPPYVK